jgi:hypothetical protein
MARIETVRLLIAIAAQRG